MLTTIDELYQFLQARKALGIRLGLTRMEKMLDMLNHPEERLKAVHIAGTNGKGSTLTFIKQALIENGYTVGTFTSPSITFHEHIHINDLAISDESLLEIVNQLFPIVEHLDQSGDPPTEYELLVIIAILYFVENVDIALVETNMGGRDDSTNCLKPILTVITNIGMDHTSFLGENKRDIAVHKAGIIKRDIPVIIGEINAEALEVILNEAYQKNAPIYRLSDRFFIKNLKLDYKDRETFTFLTDDITITNITLSLKGKHQVTNAALACMALVLLNQLDYKVTSTAIRQGLKQASIPGRFEILQDKPPIIVDGAHNLEGLRTFNETIERLYSGRKKQILFSAFQDKPVDEMVEELLGSFDQITLTTFKHPRAIDPSYLSTLVDNKQVIVNTDWQQFISSFIKNSDGQILFVTGSLYFISMVRAYVHKLKE